MNPPTIQLLPSAKRGPSDRAFGKAWLSYYAGYSRSYVKSALSALDITKSELILDPWSGSGTTGLVAQSLGYRSISVEINPVIAYLAAGHFALNSLSRVQIEEVAQLLDELVTKVGRSRKPYVSGAFVLNYLKRNTPKSLPPNSTRFETPEIVAPEFALGISIALLAYKQVAGYALTKNPSWKSHDASMVRSSDFRLSLQRQISRFIEHIPETPESSMAKQIIGDARALPLRSDSVDAIVTSPPYLTRIDYVKATAAEMTWLFGSQQLRKARLDNMGAPVIRDSTQPPRWPDCSLISDILSEIEFHNSYAAQSYYLKTFRQYFDDMYVSLSEISRVMKPGAVALLVVQNSFFKEIEIPLGELYVDLWNRCFGSGEVVSRHHTTNSMVQVNRRAVSSQMRRHLHEDTIALYK